MSESNYLMLQAQGNLKPLQERFYNELGGFYNGAAYVFPEKSEGILKQIIDHLPKSRIIPIPLGNGQTFESMQQSHKASHYRDLIYNLDAELVSLKSQLPDEIENVDEESISNANIPEHLKQKIIDLLHEKDKLKKGVDWAEGMAKALIANTTKPLELKFISEISGDYFKKPPPEKPRLLYFVENDGSKTTFLHKEITSMLVGEGGRGKTHLLALLGASVATGIPFLGQIEIEKPGAVCFVVGENNYGDIHRLLFKIYKHLEWILKINSERKDGKHFGLHCQKPLDLLLSKFIPVSVHAMNAHFIGKEGEPTKFYNQFLDQLKAKEPEEGFQLVMLDPASRFSGPEAEKDNAIATSFVACLERISEELNGRPTTMLSHHKSKSAIREQGGTQADARGSSGLTDGVRWQGNLSKGESNEHSVLEVTKTNFTSYPKKLVMKKGRDGIPEFVRWEESQSHQTTSDKKKKQSSNDAEESSYRDTLSRLKGEAQ